MSRKVNFFDERNNGVWFEHFEQPPQNLFLSKKGGKLNISALFLYELYKNSVYNSYRQKSDLACDIKSRKKEFEDHKEPFDPVYHYAVAASLGAMKEWLDPKEKMQCYFAYQNVNGRKKIIGFVHFQEKTVNGNSFVYIAQAGVVNPGNSVGRKLMQCVLSHYPEGTHFKIVTRVFNTEAKTLYGERLKFSPISPESVSKLGYDHRYCGFEYTTPLRAKL